MTVKQGGVQKTVAEGWVKQGGVVKQFYFHGGGTGNQFGMYQGSTPFAGVNLANYPFPTYGTAVSVANYDEGNPPYTFQWYFTNDAGETGNYTFYGSTTDVTCSFDADAFFDRKLQVDVTDGLSNVRTLSVPIFVSQDDPQ